MSTYYKDIQIVKLAILFYIVRPYVYIKKSYANEVSNFKKSNNIK